MLLATIRVVSLQPADKYKRPAWRPSHGKTAQTIGPSCRHSGLLQHGDALKSGRAGTRRRLWPNPCVASHHRYLLTHPLAAATAVLERASLRVAATRARSIPPPWPAYKAATAWLSPSRWWP